LGAECLLLIPKKTIMKSVETLRWVGGMDGHLRLIDQTRLPMVFVEIDCHNVKDVWEAIKTLRVRGAPAIGIAAAYWVCIGIQEVSGTDEDVFFTRFHEVVDYLATSRPTAVNLFWALKRMTDTAERLRGRPTNEIAAFLLDEAWAIREEDRRMCRAIGQHGAKLLKDGSGVLTHCNAGGLATSDYGTALALFYTAAESGKTLHIYVDETRPLLQGARLTAWELHEHGLKATLICDSMAAQVMREGRVQAVVTGADRIASNGDTANKIGTYGLAVLAKAHKIPFYIAAPSSTFDLSIAGGSEIPIEQRDPKEITHGFGRQTAPDGIDVYNPAFDVTPAELISAIICEWGVIKPVTAENINYMLDR
jgi:methylthioribose-1-phosphate isomerase